MIDYTISEKGVDLKESYKIISDDEKKIVLDCICSVSANQFKRGYKSLLREWKVHNAFYQRRWFVDRAKDCFLEYKQNIFLSLLYLILNIFVKEIKK